MKKWAAMDRKRARDEDQDEERLDLIVPFERHVRKNLKNLARRSRKHGGGGSLDAERLDEVEQLPKHEKEIYAVNEEAEVDFEEESDGVECAYDAEELKKARREETDFMAKRLNMFEFGTREEALEKSGGKLPTTTRWVDTKKANDDGGMFVRSRLVGRDFKPRREGPRDDLFASMPPLEAKKVLFRMTAGDRGRRRRNGLEEVKLLFVDVRKAHLNSECDEEVWVELPEEFHEWGRFARLKRWLYGMRKAAAKWEEDYAKKLEEVGFRRGVGSPTVFFNAETEVRLVVHGDDFTFAGVRRELEKLSATMQEWYEVKVRGIMGSGEDEKKEMTILGRQLRWTVNGIEYEADGRHREDLMEMEGLMEDSKGVKSASTKEKETGGWDDNDEEELDPEGGKQYRARAAKLNYLGLDRSDLQYATKEICTHMSKPTTGAKMKIKRAVRYLVWAPRVVWRMEEWADDDEVKIEVKVDSDWAKAKNRKSTSGGMVVVGRVGVKHWSRSQKARALSSGEAEYYALATGCMEALGVQSLMNDMGWNVEVVVVWTDSNVAKSVACRSGLGKMRHVELKYLWVQELVKTGRIMVRKERGEANVADHLTKPRMLHEFCDLLRTVGASVITK